MSASNDQKVEGPQSPVPGPPYEYSVPADPTRQPPPPSSLPMPTILGPTAARHQALLPKRNRNRRNRAAAAASAASVSLDGDVAEPFVAQAQSAAGSSGSSRITRFGDADAPSTAVAALTAPATATVAAPIAATTGYKKAAARRADAGGSHQDPIVAPSAASGGVPTPSPAYLGQAFLPPRRLAGPRPILVVMDLNGTLLHRPSPRKRPKHFVPRPFACEFVAYCLARFRVMVWSSARPGNVAAMLDALLPADLTRSQGQHQTVVVEREEDGPEGADEERLESAPQRRHRPPVAVWTRDNFGFTAADYARRVQCYKRLGVVWADPVVRASHPTLEAAAVAGLDGAGGGWSQADTVLVDDSREKARSEPFNLVEVPEFAAGGREDDILPQVHDYLNELAYQENISAYIRVNPFRPVV